MFKALFDSAKDAVGVVSDAVENAGTITVSGVSDSIRQLGQKPNEDNVEEEVSKIDSQGGKVQLPSVRVESSSPEDYDFITNESVEEEIPLLKTSGYTAGFPAYSAEDTPKEESFVYIRDVEVTLKNVGDTLLDKARAGAIAVGEGMARAAEKSKQLSTEAGEAVVDSMKTGIESVKEGVIDAVHKTEEKASDIGTSVVDTVKAGVESVKEGTTKLGEGVSEVGTKAYDSVISGAQYLNKEVEEILDSDLPSEEELILKETQAIPLETVQEPHFSPENAPTEVMEVSTEPVSQIPVGEPAYTVRDEKNVDEPTDADPIKRNYGAADLEAVEGYAESIKEGIPSTGAGEPEEAKIIEVTPDAMETVKEKLRGVAESLKEDVGDAAMKTKELSKDAGEAVVDTIKSAKESTKEGFNKFEEGITDAASKTKQVTSDFGSYVAETLKSGAGAVKAEISDVGSKVLDAAQTVNKKAEEVLEAEAPKAHPPVEFAISVESVKEPETLAENITEVLEKTKEGVTEIAGPVLEENSASQEETGPSTSAEQQTAMIEIDPEGTWPVNCSNLVMDVVFEGVDHHRASTATVRQTSEEEGTSQ